MEEPNVDQYNSVLAAAGYAGSACSTKQRYCDTAYAAVKRAGGHDYMGQSKEAHFLVLTE